MSGETPKSGLEPLRRLLESAREGSGEAKVDALVALSQRTLFVATWEPESLAFRTLSNPKGESALPVFTGADVFPEARERFGWPPNTTLREFGARQAFRYVVDNALDCLIVDVCGDYAFEALPHELAPLVAPPPRHSPSGPFASVGKTSSQLLRAVNASEYPREPDAAPASTSAIPPPKLESVRPAPSPGAETLPPPPRPPPMPSAHVDEVILEALEAPPSDELLEALAEALGGFLEVEWAAYCHAARGPRPARPAVALRLDPYRDRLGEILASLESSAARAGTPVDVILADTPHLVRLVRERGVLFHPWLDRPRRQ